MADLKAAFRAAKEQRGSKAPSVAHLRALKQQHKQPEQAPQTRASPSPASASASPAPNVPGASKESLPSNFFDAPKAPAAAAASQSSGQQSRPSTSGPSSAGAGKAAAAGTAGVRTAAAAAGAAPLPEGFFADKAADAKARGVKLPDAKEREQEFQEFQRMLEDELKQSAAAEAEEAEEEAEDRAEREGFVQWLRMQRLEELKKRKAAGQPSSEGGGEAADEDAGPSIATAAAELLDQGAGEAGRLEGISLPKRRRVLDTLKELEAAGEGSDEGDEDEGLDDGALLDWRSKGV